MLFCVNRVSNMDSFGNNNLHFNSFVIGIYGCVKMPPQIKLSFEQNRCYSFRTRGKQKPLLSLYILLCWFLKAIVQYHIIVASRSLRTGILWYRVLFKLCGDCPVSAWVSVCLIWEKMKEINATNTRRRKNGKTRAPQKWTKPEVITWSTCVMLSPTVTTQAAALHVPQHCPGSTVYL